MKEALKKVIRNLLPKPIYGSIARNIRFLLPDLIKKISGKNDLIPPGRMIFTGGTPDNFKEGGEEFFRLFKSHGSLKPDERILDIGCGIGRMTLPLTTYLSSRGHYSGFDIVPGGIKWCKENIGSKFPNFKFELADIYNKEYNPTGRLKASEFQFPYPDNTFDFVFATSVFTHMFADDIQHYLKEASRVMKPGARCILTFFLMNPEAERLIKEGRSLKKFESLGNGIFVQNKKVPEEAVSIPEVMVREMFSKARIEIQEPIRFGGWCRREQWVSAQDFILGKKI